MSYTEQNEMMISKFSNCELHLLEKSDISLPQIEFGHIRGQ